jgi:hypothetical protein
MDQVEEFQPDEFQKEQFEIAEESVKYALLGEFEDMIDDLDEEIEELKMNPGKKSDKVLKKKMELKRDIMKDVDKINVCCNEDEKRMIMVFGLELFDKYRGFELEHIFEVLIFSYYGHNLLEQSGFDVYSNRIINKNESFKQVFDTIYFKIGSSNEPIFKKIRRAFLGFKSGGRRHKRTKRGRSTKNKTRRHKRRHTRKH